MKYVIYILLALFLFFMFTCRSHKNAPRHMKMAKPESIDTVAGVWRNQDNDGVPDYQEYDTNYPEYEKAYKSAPPEYQKKIKAKKTTIVDNSEETEENNQKFVKGLIARSVPDEMTVGKHYSVKIRISKDTTEKKTLIVGDTKIHIADTSIQSTVTIESIRVSSIMSASLTSKGDYFEITSKSTETQNIEQFGYTEWEWDVKPLKSGNNPLKLIVKVRIVSEDGEKSFKDIVVFEKDIATKANISYSIKILIAKYWQWSLSTLIIPFIVWLYNRKKKKKDE
jgi:hypothetical protein